MQLVWFYRLNPFRLFHRKISKIESTLMDSIYSTVEWNGMEKAKRALWVTTLLMVSSQANRPPQCTVVDSTILKIPFRKL